VFNSVFDDISESCSAASIIMWSTAIIAWALAHVQIGLATEPPVFFFTKYGMGNQTYRDEVSPYLTLSDLRQRETRAKGILRRVTEWMLTKGIRI